MADDLAQIERLAGALLRNLSAPERRGLLRRMARTLQQGQSRRIGAQLNPDGSRFEPRKPPQQSGLRARTGGSLRRKAMFQRLRKPSILRAGADDRSLWVGFAGRASRIAEVHQYGLRDRPSLRQQAVPYPRRELLGPTDADRTTLLDMLYDHIANV